MTNSLLMHLRSVGFQTRVATTADLASSFHIYIAVGKCLSKAFDMYAFHQFMPGMSTAAMYYCLNSPL